jgi:hypothetical protein
LERKARRHRSVRHLRIRGVAAIRSGRAAPGRPFGPTDRIARPTRADRARPSR